jgi:very-short-patch-repair endonuclease
MEVILTDIQKSLLLSKETEAKFGYKIQDLSHGSTKRVIHKCEICGLSKETKYKEFLQGIAIVHRQCVPAKSIQTCLRKFGVEHPAQSKEIHDKMKQTNLLAYGVENVFQSEKHKKKIKQALRKKYGVDNPQQSAQIKEKSEQTCLKRYGVKNIGQLQSGINEKHCLFLKRHGIICSPDEALQRLFQFIMDYFQKEGYTVLSDLSKEYIDCLAPISVRCPDGDVYKTTWSRFFHVGGRCPYHKNFKREKQLGKILEQIYLDKVKQYDNLSFLQPQTVDFSVRSLKLAFEYDGEQHYRPVRFGGAKMTMKQARDNLVLTQKRDRLKERLCKKNGYTLIRVKYDEDLTTEHIRQKIQLRCGNV